MIPLRGHGTKKINTGGSGKDPKVSFRAKDTGCETALSFWIYSIQFDCKLHVPDCTFFYVATVPDASCNRAPHDLYF